MQSLSEMGIPIYSETGPRGGFRLMEGFQLSPLQFNAQEALILLMALEAITKITDTANSKWLKIFYRSQNHQRWLHIFPKKVYASNGFWYFEAFSSTHGEERLFRVDRMDRIEISDPPVQEQAVPALKIDDELKNQTIRIRANLTYRGMLCVEQDNHIGERITEISDEKWVVDFQCPATDGRGRCGFSFPSDWTLK